MEQIALATRGLRDGERPTEWEWREALMEVQRQQYHVPPEDHQSREDR